MNLYGYAAGDPINNSDPFGLSADTGSVEAQQPADDAPGADPCAVYAQKNSLPIRAICTMVNGPSSGPENTCTANCLAYTWARMFGGRDEVGWDEQRPYLYPGHEVCYSELWLPHSAGFQWVAEFRH